MSISLRPAPAALSPAGLLVALASSALAVWLWSRLASPSLPLAWALSPALGIAGALAARHGALAAGAAALGGSLILASGPLAWLGVLGTALAAVLGATLPGMALMRLAAWQPTEHLLVQHMRRLLATMVGGAAVFALLLGALAGLLDPPGDNVWAAPGFEHWLGAALGYGVWAPGIQSWLARPVGRSRQRWLGQHLDGLSLGLCGALLAGIVVLRAQDAPGLALFLAGLYLPLILWSALRSAEARHASTVTLSSVAMLAVIPLDLTAAQAPLVEVVLGAVLILGPAAVSFIVQGCAADRDRAHDQLAETTRCDLSTGLLTDRGLRTELAEQLAAPDRPNRGLIGLQVSNFETLSELCGTLATVHFEQSTAQLLRAQAGVQCAARLTAGRYVLVIDAETVAQVRAVAREIYAQLSGQLFATEQHSLRLQVCMGGLLIDRQTSIEADDCLGALSDAWAIAASVRDPQLFVEPLSQMMIDARRTQQAKLEHLREAVREARIELYAQPLVDPDAPAGQLSYEILTRMRDRDGSLMQPPEFLALAVQAQMSVTFDRAVVAQTFEWLARHPDALQRTHRCSINLTGASVSEGTMADFIRAQRARFELPADRLVFEISEGEALRNPSAVSRLVDDLKAQGFGIALDDFGTGLATFEYLRRFPLDYIKIDGSFIRNLVDSAIDEEIVVSTVRVAQRLNLRTIAEHVHTEPVFRRLQDMGVDFLQGDLFGSPQPISALFEHFPECAAVGRRPAVLTPSPDRNPR